MDMERKVAKDVDLSRPVGVEKKQAGYSQRLGEEGASLFANRLAQASVALEQGRPGFSAALAPARQYLPFLGDALADIESRQIEVKSFGKDGQTVQLAATPAGLSQQADITIGKMIDDLDATIEKLPEQERSEAVSEVVRALYPDAAINRDRATTGRLGDIRIKIGSDRTENLKRGFMTAAMATTTLLENAKIKSVIGSLNLVEEVTAAPGYTPTAMRWYSSDHLRNHRENTEAHSLEDLMKSSVQAELLLRECLVHRQGRAQPEMNASRARFMGDLVASWRERERELKQLAADRDNAIAAAAHNEQERIRREQNERVRESKEELMTDLALETAADRAFGLKVIRQMEKEPLTAMVLEDSVLGQPLLERLRDDMVSAAMREGPTRGDIKAKRDGKH